MGTSGSDDPASPKPAGQPLPESAEEPSSGASAQSSSTTEPLTSPAPLPMTAFWAVFLYFNLQFAASLVSPLIVLYWQAINPEWRYPGDGPLDSAQLLDRLRIQLWSQVLVLPLQLFILAFFGGRQLLRLGHMPSMGRFLAGFVVVSGLCYGINLGMTQLMEKGLGIPPPAHPLTRLGAGAAGPFDWILLTLSACLVAPLIEETFFRRLVPAWFAYASGPRTLALLGIGAALLLSPSQPPHGPVLTLCAVGWAVVIWVVVEWNQHWSLETGLWVASSGLFSAIHSFAWPTPVALFLFGLWQFRLARRSQGIGAVVLFHALFNAIGVANLWIWYG